jgi:hypothetical protein
MGRRGVVLVIPMSGKKAPERRSGLRPSEKELPERRSGALCHKNTLALIYPKTERHVILIGHLWPVPVLFVQESL